MNRAQRRAARRAGIPDTAVAYAERYRCPDCTAATELHVIDGVPTLDVLHDDTCPRLKETTDDL